MRPAVEVSPRRLIVFAAGRIDLLSIADATEVVHYRHDGWCDTLLGARLIDPASFWEKAGLGAFHPQLRTCYLKPAAVTVDVISHAALGRLRF